MVIAAIDCADDLNTQHCRDYEIMGYPTIRYFGPRTANVTNGEEFARGDDEVGSLRHTVVTKLEATEKATTAPPHWPDLLLVPDKDALWRDQGKQLLLLWNDPAKRLVLLVIENEASFAGSELILDLKEAGSVSVKRVLDSSAGRSAAGDAPAASVQVFAFARPEPGDQRPAPPKAVPVEPATRETMFGSVRRYLRSLGVDVPDVFAQHYAPVERQRRPPQSAEQLRLANSVYADDLAAALRYSLFHEVPLQSSIAGEKMAALAKYVAALNKYYPADAVAGDLLLNVARELPAYERISGRDFKKMARTYGAQLESAPRQWVACQGSDSTLRGYPCGLWTLFHTLTVRELVALQRLEQRTQPQALNAMAAYIKNFFGCADCAQHFTEMARTIAGNVSTPVDSVLWLWRAHNKVNSRLAGDGSEDPAFPKVQFPVRAVCPECYHADGSWNELKVLDYLVRMYSNPQQAGQPQRLRGEERATSGSGWNLGLDVRACVGLYVLCACLLTVYTLRFFIKRNPRTSRPNKYEFSMKA